MLSNALRRASFAGRSRLIHLRLLSSNAAETVMPAANDPVRGPTLSHKSSPKVNALVDELVSLNMLEVKAVTDILKDRLGIDDTMTMPAMNPAMFAGMAASPVPAAGAAEEPAPEKTAFDLKLEAYDAAKKIAVIKEIRAITNLGLKEAKALVDDAPKVFKNGVLKEEAQQIRDKLKELGATVVLE